jgi:hypothetical protein
MSEGPTVAGSIIGKLSLQKAEWDRVRDEAKADAKELGDLHPTIKVDADVAAALAKLEEVRAAEGSLGGSVTSRVNQVVTGGDAGSAAGRLDSSTAAAKRLEAAQQQLAAAERVSANAATALELAEMRVQAVQDKRGRTDLQVANTQAQLSRATLGVEAADQRHEAAIKKVTAAESELANVTDEVDRSNQKAASSAGTTVTRMGLIVAAIAAAIPVASAFTGYIVGVGGALGLMGAAGVVAFLGIKDAMASGSSAGAQYSAGLAQLSGILDYLKQTASDGILNAFNQSVASVGRALPALNLQIGIFTEYLGRTGNNLLDGVLSALNVLNPLFLQAADYVEQLSVGFKNWTQDGGLQKWANYAIQMLPQVEQMLSSLVGAAMHLIDALTPLGGAIIQALTMLGDAISNIPSGDLLILASAAAVVFSAFSAWKSLSPIIDSLSSKLAGVSSAALTGVAGIAAVAVAANTAALAGAAAATSWANRMMGVTQGTNQWSDSISKGNINVDNLGLTLSRTGGFWNDFANNMDIAGTYSRSFYQNAKDLDAALAMASPKDLVASYQQLIKEGARVGKTTQDIADEFPKATAAYKLNKVAVEEKIVADQQATDEQTAVAASLGITIDQLNALTNSNKAAKTATDLLKESLDLLNGKSISAAQAQNAFDSAIANSDKHIDATGKTINRANTELDGMTAAAVKNRGELVQQTSAAQANAEAFRNAGGSAADTRQKLMDMRQAIIANAVAHGEDTAKVQAFIDTIFKIPATVPPTKLEVENANALAALNAVRTAIDGIPRNIVVTVQAIRSSGLANAPGRGALAFADGGTVGGSGGPKSDSVAAWLSTGEEVTPNPQAGRYRPVLKALASDNVAGARTALGGSGGVTYNQYFTLPPNTDTTALSQSISMRQNRLGAA